jgi:hypothetical protein
MALPSLTLVATGLLAAAFALVVAAGLDLTWLRAATPVLRGRADLTRFRRAVTRQRWACLGVLVLLIGAGAVFLVGLLGGWCRPDDLPLTAGAGVPLLAAEWWLRSAEARFKAVPAANPRIRAAWERVVLWWEEHPVPDW